LRPYGATPLAGMLSDARAYLLQDTSNDPATGKPFGPAKDPYYLGSCRKQFIILLSDGEPNLDLRDACATGNGKCPYPKPHEVANELATLSNPIKTFAIGFGLSQAGGVDCSALKQTDLTDPAGMCANATGTLRACCTLGRIAYEGGTERAYFATDLPTLKAALDKVLAFVSSGSTSRTIPVFANAGSTGSQGDAGAAGYQFVSSFEAPPGELWTGNLERKRYACVNENGILKPKLQSIDASKGDDFRANLASGNPGRKFLTATLQSPPNLDFSRGTIRTSAVADGLSTRVGVSSGLVDSVTLASALTPAALGIGASPLPEACKSLNAASAAACAKTVIAWETGDPFVPSSRKGRELGSIYHATPETMGLPRDFLRDESYAAFAADAQVQKRPLVLFSATTDGQLHAFKIASNDASDTLKADKLANNELWSFLPPYVLPGILPTYGQQAFLLDGSPVIKDVIFERSSAQAQAGASGAKWRTVLVAGGGLGGGFYYALDVTNPADPKFLWQIATDDSGAPLFGRQTPKPAIATIAYQKPNEEVKEVAVAILAGGAAPLANGTCARVTTGSRVASDEPYSPKLGGGAVRCWHDANGKVGAARSLTIVRIDTGEVLMSLRGAAGDGPQLPGRMKENMFDSPVTGVPVPFPSQTGQVSDRVYVGDADGSLWRVDLSRPQPASWTVELAWDAYSFPTDSAATRQPIETPPIVSVDPLGTPVILLSTGDQETFTSSAGVQTRVWSLREPPENGAFVLRNNWVIPFQNGVRVTGPISLFNGAAYFSTFTPTGDVNNACSDGFGSVWGVDYLYPNACSPNGPTPPTGWPCPRYVKDPVGQPGQVSFAEDQPPGTVVFGVAVTQTPGCYETASFPDPYLGAISTVGNATAGEFQLVFQTGQGGQASEGSKTNTVTKRLPPPRSTVRIDSWGLVLE
jgi:type IV pilus assembly protein PilY1